MVYDEQEAAGEDDVPRGVRYGILRALYVEYLSATDSQPAPCMMRDVVYIVHDDDVCRNQLGKCKPYLQCICSARGVRSAKEPFCFLSRCRSVQLLISALV